MEDGFEFWDESRTICLQWMNHEVVKELYHLVKMEFFVYCLCQQTMNLCIQELLTVTWVVHPIKSWLWNELYRNEPESSSNGCNNQAAAAVGKERKRNETYMMMRVDLIIIIFVGGGGDFLFSGNILTSSAYRLINILLEYLELMQKLDEKAVNEVFLKVLDNYIKWCKYLRIRLAWNRWFLRLLLFIYIFLLKHFIVLLNFCIVILFKQLRGN